VTSRSGGKDRRTRERVRKNPLRGEFAKTVLSTQVKSNKLLITSMTLACREEKKDRGAIFKNDESYDRKSGSNIES